MSARILAEVPLESPDSALQESLVFCRGEGEAEPVAGRFIRPKEIKEISHVTELAVILAGLPGDAWGVATDKKVRAALQSEPLREDGIRRAAFRLLPPGTKRTYAGLSANERSQAAKKCPEFTGRDFSMEAFMNYFRDALAAVRWHDYVTVRATGHSYGAQALLNGLVALDQGGRTALPKSATFLAPFVRNALAPERRDIALHLRKEGDETEEPLPWVESLGMLETLLTYAGRKFNLKDKVPLIAQHRDVLTPEFFDEMRPISSVQSGSCAVRVVMAHRDEHLGNAHYELLSSRLAGGSVPLPKSVLPYDRHDMASLEGRAFFA